MHILHMVASISPESGGPTEVIRMLIRHAPHGDTAEVVTLDDPTAPFLQDLPFEVHALGSSKKRWYSPKLLPWLRTNRSRFDAAIIHGLWQYPGLAARLTLKGHIPYAVFPHGMLDPYFKRDRLKHLKKQVYWLLAETWVLRSAKRILFTTQRESDLARESFWPSKWNAAITPLGTDPSPLFVIPQGSASLPEPTTESQSADTALINAFHQRCPRLKDKSFLLYLGRIDPKKGCDLLVEAFGEWTTRLDNTDLHLVMAGPDSTGWWRTLDDLALMHCIEHLVHWPGMLTGDAKWGALAACEAFILPSHQENFGIAVVEALASGKPVLISNQINIAPEIEADNCGLVEPDTLEGTRRLLDRWLALSEEERAAMSARARTTFATRYDMRQNTAAILNIFKPTPL